MKRKHTLPEFLVNVVTPNAYEHWLERKARAHRRRDKGRGRECTRAAYKEAIHAAVILSEGKDAYTDEKLDWHLISTYKNEESKNGRHAYKSRFALLPTLDHETAEATEASFKICGWRTNDAKNDLSTGAFIELCERVLRHAGFKFIK